MTTTETILQCARCLRYFADGKLVSVSLGDVAAALRAGQLHTDFLCDGDFLAGCVAACKVNQDRAEAQRARRLAGRKKVVRVAPASVNPGDFRSSCPPEVERNFLPEPRTQREFEDSGAATRQNEILINFFSDPMTDSVQRPDGSWVENWFPMPYLCEISGAFHMNNRVIDLRRHFEPLGFGFFNEQRQVHDQGALMSQYIKLPIAECERRERERAERRAAAREEKSLQTKFV